jgi:hypothetical protein
MPGDPKQCREHAKRCLELAHEATNPALKDSLSDIAQQWMRLATDLEATKRLLDAWGEPSLWQAKTGCVSGLTPDSFSRLAENTQASKNGKPA